MLFLIFSYASYLLAGQKFDDKFATTLGSLVTAAAVLFAAVTLRKMKESNDFSVITAFHSRLIDPISYESRGYLFERFKQDLCSVSQNIFTNDCIKSGSVDIDWILKNVNKDEEKEIEFNTQLKKIPSGVSTMSSLVAVERVLLDFDLIAVPFCEGNESARLVAHAWKPVLEKTYESMLPFIAIKTRLRSHKSYKFYYLKLINDLGIDLKGINVPERP